MIVSTSWDDGHPADARIADLLSKYDLAGTFYIPIRNIEGRPVMSGATLRQLAAEFEIASHTYDHVKLTGLLPSEVERQIRDGRTSLQDILGAKICGFCYPRGKYDSTTKEIVRRLGFEYARGANNFRSTIGTDRFEIPVTAQFFPHSNLVYVKNLIRHGVTSERLKLMIPILRIRSLADRFKRLIDLCHESGGVFHVWGHSWEIDELNLWHELEDVFKYLRMNYSDFVNVTNQKLAPIGRSPKPGAG